MPKQTLTATATVTTNLKLSPKQVAMITARIEENAKLAAEIAEREARRKRLKDEVQSIFADAGEELALIDGCEVGGVSLSMVTGSVPKWDKVGFLKKHNLSAADYEEFVKTTPKEPYLLIGKKGGK